jgi:HAD superfamily hydrolase (TIGR01509 family)
LEEPVPVQHPVAAVLFDLDGTLVDSEAAIIRAWQGLCAETGLDLAQILRVHTGRQTASTIRLVAPDLDQETVEAMAAAVQHRECHDTADITPCLGAVELLEALDAAGIPWAVVTSGNRTLAGNRLAAAGIKPPLLVTADDISAGKPDPEGFLLAARLLGVPPEHCLVVEDAPAGVEAGRRAGARVVGVRGVPADVAVTDLREIAALALPAATR